MSFVGTPKVQAVQAVVSGNVGVIDAQEIQLSTASQSKRQSSYVKWTDKQRFDIGKYAAENGNANALRNFKGEFATLTESTVRTFKKKYYQEVTAAAKEQRQPSQKLTRYSQPTGRPRLLGEIDEMVQTYLMALSKRGGVVNTTVANATAKALMSKYPNVVGDIDIESARWAKSLFTRMHFVRRRKTSSKVDIPDRARKEIEFLFLHDVVSKVEKYKIPPPS